MSRHPDQSDNPPQTGLEALYRDHGDAEPDSGLDRIIHARAERALESPRRHGPAPWIAGLATVGALVLAVGVVLQQSPSPPVDAPVPAARDEGSPAMRAAAPTAEQAAEVSRLHAPLADVFMESANVAGLAEVAKLSKDAAILEIRALLAADETDQARERLQALRHDHPDFEIPADLISILAAPAQEPPQPD